MLLAPLRRYVPDDRDTQLDYRPDYFESFDRWLQQLRDLLDPASFAAVTTALAEDGRHIDVHRLAAKHRLKRSAVKLVRLLSRFGDVGHPIHAFASVCVAEVTASSESAKPLTTYIMATRRHGKLDFWWADTADGFGALGVRDLLAVDLDAVSRCATGRSISGSAARWLLTTTSTKTPATDFGAACGW